MEKRWNLDALYTSFDSSEFQTDFKRVDFLIEKITQWAKDNLRDKEGAQQKIEEYISYMLDYGHLFSRLYTYCELVQSVDSRNEKAKQFSEMLTKKNSEMTSPSVAFEKWLGHLENLDAIIHACDLLKEHEFYLNEIKDRTKYLLSEKEEVVLSKMKPTGSTAWTNLWQVLTSQLMVDIEINGEEKTLPLSRIRNLAYEKDEKTRKAGYYAEQKAYKKVEDAGAACLNAIKGEVLTTSAMRGYKSPLHLTLFNSRMDQSTLDAMLAAMKESMPHFRRYFRRKADLLGHDNGLPFYDLFAPMGSADISFTYAEARQFIVNTFAKFSQELADFADQAFENKWIDAEPREGKVGGAFCYNLHAIKQSRILSNFTGSFSDVTTLAHELGHAYHGSSLNSVSYLNSNYPMPLAETASIFCETIIGNAALENISQEELFTILESDLSSAGQVVVDIYSRYLFESRLFEQRKEASLSIDDLKKLMLEAQKDSYGDGLDHDTLHPYMWLNKPHYYFPDHNYYNFPYAFGLLFAKGLYAEYLKQGASFIAKYDELLRATGCMKVSDVAKMMNINVQSTDFWSSSLQLIEKQIEKFISLDIVS